MLPIACLGLYRRLFGGTPALTARSFPILGLARSYWKMGGGGSS